MGRERDRMLADLLLEESQRIGKTPEQLMEKDRSFWTRWARSPERDVIPTYITDVVDKWVRELQQGPTTPPAGAPEFTE